MMRVWHVKFALRLEYVSVKNENPFFKEESWKYGRSAVDANEEVVFSPFDQNSGRKRWQIKERK